MAESGSGDPVFSCTVDSLAQRERDVNRDSRSRFEQQNVSSPVAQILTLAQVMQYHWYEFLFENTTRVILH